MEQTVCKYLEYVLPALIWRPFIAAPSPSVHLSPVPGLQDVHDQRALDDFVEYPIVPHPDPVDEIRTFELLRHMRPRVFPQAALSPGTNEPELGIQDCGRLAQRAR